MLTKPLISVVTVVYNAVNSIEQTILSVIGQTYKNIHYIIIDGGSTDGTIDIINKYKPSITYFISEKDKGIFDAMNKGIAAATGDWLLFVNSGDMLYSEKVLESIFDKPENFSNADVIYGRSKMYYPDGKIIEAVAGHSLNEQWKGPVFRHGAMFAKTEILKKENFITDDKTFNVSADFELIYRLHKKGYAFKETHEIVVLFEKEGVSDNIIKNYKDNYKIIQKHNDATLKKYLYYQKQVLTARLKKSFLASLLLPFSQLLLHYFPNHIINHIPFYALRHFYYRNILKVSLGHRSSIHLNTFIEHSNIYIGNNTTINRNCYLDGRGVLRIGNNVSVSQYVHLITSDHNHQSKTFHFRSGEIIVEDYVWIGSRATILPNVKIGKGAVVCACAIVTRDVKPYDIVAGIPAKSIGTRTQDMKYSPEYFDWFD